MSTFTRGESCPSTLATICSKRASPPAYTMALQSLAEAAEVIPELKELIG
jgi:hypothetical protein